MNNFMEHEYIMKIKPTSKGQQIKGLIFLKIFNTSVGRILLR